MAALSLKVITIAIGRLPTVSATSLYPMDGRNYSPLVTDSEFTKVYREMCTLAVTDQKDPVKAGSA